MSDVAAVSCDVPAIGSGVETLVIFKVLPAGAWMPLQGCEGAAVEL